MALFAENIGPAVKIKAFKDDLMTFMETEHPEIVSEITDTGKISDELKEQVLSAVRQFKSR